MKVEADYKGKGRYYKGKITRDNRDGTYDITYDDGDREFGKRADTIRSLEDDRRPSSPGRGSRLEEGMKVEARYRGKSRYYSGRIRRDNRDGTYDIDYDDGEKEMGVAEELIRVLAAGAERELSSSSRFSSTSSARASTPPSRMSTNDRFQPSRPRGGINTGVGLRPGMRKSYEAP